MDDIDENDDCKIHKLFNDADWVFYSRVPSKRIDYNESSGIIYVFDWPGHWGKCKHGIAFELLMKDDIVLFAPPNFNIKFINSGLGKGPRLYRKGIGHKIEDFGNIIKFDKKIIYFINVEIVLLENITKPTCMWSLTNGREIYIFQKNDKDEIVIIDNFGAQVPHNILCLIGPNTYSDGNIEIKDLLYIRKPSLRTKPAYG